MTIREYAQDNINADMHRARAVIQVGNAVDLIRANQHLLTDQMISTLTQVLDKITNSNAPKS